MQILPSAKYKKLNKQQQKIVDKAAIKLFKMLSDLDDFESIKINNPVIHDSYDKRFYAFKFVTTGFSVRLLYRYGSDLEIHKIHFKHGDKDAQKYIADFEDYVRNFKED